MTLEVFFLLVAGFVFLIAGGEGLVRGASKLATVLGVPPIVVGLTVVAFGTSAPELAVSLKATFSGNADIAVANVVGSNIFNLLFILGASALISPLVIHSQMIRREVPLMIGVSAIVYGMSMLDQRISVVEGGMLALGIFLYTGWIVFEALKNRKENLELQKESEKEFGKKEASTTRVILLSLALVVGGLGVIMLGADWLVQGAISTAKLLGVSDAVIGLTIVAAGTSLPEVVASIMATLKGERDIAVGNVVGSNIYNILAILGFSGALSDSGLKVADSIQRFDMPVMVGISALTLILFYTGNKLSRKEGALFLVLYVAYTTFLISQA